MTYSDTLLSERSLPPEQDAQHGDEGGFCGPTAARSVCGNSLGSVQPENIRERSWLFGPPPNIGRLHSSSSGKGKQLLILTDLQLSILRK